MALLVLGGCASTASQTEARNVKNGDPATVNRDCKLLGTVNGRSVFGGSEAGRTEGAVMDVRAKAAAMGATHIVVMNVDTSGMFNTGQATARAYKC
jgi:hypothetical protein